MGMNISDMRMTINNRIRLTPRTAAAMNFLSIRDLVS
jgi:hypothetical protein